MLERWQPDPQDVLLLMSDITQKFTNGHKVYYQDPNEPQAGVTIAEKPSLPSETFIEDCAKIGAFLMDEQACIHQLQKLNTLLKVKSEQTGKNDVYLLRQTLEEELAKVGFEPHFAKALDVLTPEIFRATVYNGVILKDAAINPAHGEFAHAIQWLIIAWAQEEFGFLSEAAINIFKQLGEEKSVYFRVVNKKKSTLSQTVFLEDNIWNLIVDKSDRIDFRTPEKLTSFIIAAWEELDMLSFLVKERQHKRDNEPVDKFSKKYGFAEEGDQTRYQSQNFFRKSNKGTYQPGQLPGVLESDKSKVDLAEFRKSQHPSKSKVSK